MDPNQQHSNPYISQLTSKQNEVTVQIRKINRSETIIQKRQLNKHMEINSKSNQIQVESHIAFNTQTENKSNAKSLSKSQQAAETNLIFQQAITSIHIGTDTGLLQGIKLVKKLVSRPIDPPIQQIIDYGLLQIIINCAVQMQKSQLKQQASWILINLCCGTLKQITCMIQKGILKVLSNMLKLDNMALIENSVWSLANIATQKQLVKVIISINLIEQIVQVTKKIASPTLMKNAGWFFSNIIRNDAKLTHQRIKLITPILLDTFELSHEKQDTFFQSLWGLSYIASTKAAQLEVMKPTIIEKLMQNFTINNQSSNLSTLKIINGLCTNVQNIDILFQQKLFYIVTAFVCNENTRTRQQALTLLKNTTKHSQKVAKTFAQTQKFMRQLIKLSQHQEPKLLKLIIQIFQNFAINLPFNLAVSIYATYQIMRSLTLCLLNKSNDVILTVLQTLKSTFEVCEPGSTNVFKQMFDRNGGSDFLQKLQHSQSDQVYEQSLYLLESYYQLEDSIQ